MNRTLLGVLVLLQVLNFSGFSYRQFRWLPDGELVGTAVEEQLPLINSEGEIDYKTASDFLSRNSCIVERYFHEWNEPVFRILGRYIVVVVCNARISNTNQSNNFYEFEVAINASGRIVDSRGIVR